MKKKIIFILPTLDGGGAERVVINLINNLDDSLFEFNLIVIGGKSVFSNFINKNINVLYLNKKRTRNSFFMLIKILHNFKPNIVFSTLGHLNLILIVLKLFSINKFKIIIREPNTPSIFLNDFPKYKKYFFYFLYRIIYPKANIIIAQCNQMRHDIISTYHIRNEKVLTIYNPIDIDHINSRLSISNPFKKNEEINFLAIGRLTNQKGFDILIESFYFVKKELPSSNLVILGDGPLHDKLINKISFLGLQDSVFFKGFVSNPYQYLKFCDVYVLSSRYEGFPNTLLEALACGCKVVATDCMSGPKEIIGNSQFGTLVDVNSVESLAEGMISSYRNENKSSNRCEFFDIKKIIKEYEVLFNSI